MSEEFLVFLVIVGIIAYFVLTQKVIPSLVTKGVNSTVLRGAKRGGEELVSNRLMCRVNASQKEMMKAILATVKVAPNVPPLIADAYLIEATDNHIVYRYGNKLNPQNFRGLLRSIESTDGRPTVFWEIVDWTESGGIVDGQSVMNRLVADINTALRSVDPNASLR